jgi:cyclopropane-fatty-acyl-phospholipid synthase
MSNADNQTANSPHPGSGAGGLFKSYVFGRFARVLNGFRDGQLTIVWPNGQSNDYGTPSEKANSNATIELHNYKPIRSVISEGQLGFAESYLNGDWSTDSLENLFSLFMRNEIHVQPKMPGGRLSQYVNALRHRLRKNSEAGSKKNIAYHYDLGNDFYKRWLDETMSYSSGLYLNDSDTLHQAQLNKQQRVIDLLDAQQNSRMLEIGCGWGSLAAKVASETSSHVTAISLSNEQLSFAKDKYKNNANSIDFKFIDYRNVTGKFDHIFSIEMFEAVGQQYWSTYFNKLAELLDAGGTAVLQVITLLEDRFDAYRARPDYIQKYIFPGGMLPTKTHLREYAEKAGFDLEHDQWFGSSYAKTLSEWHARFEAAADDIRSLNFDERFMRMWRYYLVYCETGFGIGHTDVGLVKLKKR